MRLMPWSSNWVVSPRCLTVLHDPFSPVQPTAPTHSADYALLICQCGPLSP